MIETHAPLIAETVSRKYGTRTVVNTANLTLPPGTVTALLGQSGAGKSTLLRMFAGLERPDAGTVRIGDTILSDARTMIPAETRRIGLVFQDFALFPHMTIQQNVMFGLTHFSRGDADRRVTEWLTRLGLADRAAAYPHQLSGGEQQRVAIARAMAPEPRALLMDEPFSGLDPALREDVRRAALTAISESGIPALLVTHDAHEAMLSADQLAIMRGGHIVQSGTPDAVYLNPVDLETASALGPVIVLAGVAHAGRREIETDFGALAMPENTPAGPVQIAVRPEGVIPDPASTTKALITACRRAGPLLHVDILIGNTNARIFLPHTAKPTPGDHIGVRLDSHCYAVFT